LQSPFVSRISHRCLSSYPAGPDYKIGKYKNEKFTKSWDERERVLDHFAQVRGCMYIFGVRNPPLLTPRSPLSLKHRATAVLRTPTSAACPLAMEAAISGGFKICEFTLTTPDAMHHMTDFKSRYCNTDIMFGMGTIMNVEDAEMSVEGGAEFIITPIFIPEVGECLSVGVVDH